MNVQYITTPDGERLVILPESEYRAVLEAAEDASDLAAIQEFRRRIEAGEEELVPAPFADRLIDGENPVRVWRDYRGLTVKALAEQIGIAPAYLSQIETGAREGSIGTYRKLAEALKVQVDDLI